MALTTAERQRRFRAKRAAEIANLKAKVAELEKAIRVPAIMPASPPN